jgi:DNA-binding MarR family transcriptional regulator
MSSGKTVLIDAIGRLVMRFQDASQQFDETVGELYDLSAAERHCLSFLWHGSQTASAVARAIRLTPAAVTALIDRLEKRGYVRRQSDPSDRRKVLVAITEKTVAMTAATYTPAGEAGAKVLSRYTEAELRTFARLLEECIAIQERMTDELVARHAKEKAR